MELSIRSQELCKVGALWIVPFVAIPIELVISRLAHWLDPRLGWTLLGYTQHGAQALLEALVTMTLSFVVFTFASLLVAIQIAGGQLTPRIIATTLLRDDLVRYTVGLFLFTLPFALAQDQMAGGGVHQAVISLAAALGVLCLAAFLYLIDHAARLLRPISILRKVAGAGLTVIDSAYPEPTATQRSASGLRRPLGAPERTIHHDGVSEIVLAVNAGLLVSEAQKAGALIELVPQVGTSLLRTSRSSTFTAVRA